MPEAPRADHFPLFDALRGLAAIAVVTYHGVYLPALFNGIGGAEWWRFAIHLDVAVPIFLGISGFLLYRPFVAARLRGRDLPSVRAYAWRRVLRIVPGFWFALTVLTLWFWANPPGFSEVRSVGGVLRFYLFAQIYDADTAIAAIGQAWTLGVEVVFYVALPLWAIAMRRLRPALRTELLGISALIAFSLLWKVAVLSQVDPSSRSALPAILPMPTWIDHLAIGMGLAALSVHVQDHRPSWGWLAVVERRPAVAWAAALALWLGACLVGPNGAPDDPVTDRVYLLRHVLYGLFVACLLVPAVFGEPGRGGVRRLLAWRPLAYVGTISFSFYLFHYDVLHQLERWWGRAPERGWELLPWWAAAIAGSVLLGTLGYRLVELPAMRLGRRIVGRRRDREAAAAQVHAAP